MYRQTYGGARVNEIRRGRVQGFMTARALAHPKPQEYPRRMRLSFGFFLAGALTGSLLSACGGGSASAKATASGSTTGTLAASDPALKSKLANCDEKGKKMVKLDINHDDRP